MDKVEVCRKKHLRPLTKLRVDEIIVHIETLKKNSAIALMAAMQSASTTNCGWVEYDIAKRFRPDVVRRLEHFKNKKRLNCHHVFHAIDEAHSQCGKCGIIEGP